MNASKFAKFTDTLLNRMKLNNKMIAALSPEVIFQKFSHEMFSISLEIGIMSRLEFLF
jgi:hypothetical protein